MFKFIMPLLFLVPALLVPQSPYAVRKGDTLLKIADRAPGGRLDRLASSEQRQVFRGI